MNILYLIGKFECTVNVSGKEFESSRKEMI